MGKIVRLTESELTRIISEKIKLSEVTRLIKNIIKEGSNDQENVNYDNGLLSLHLVGDALYDGKLERFITFNSFGGGWQIIRPITNSELRYLKSIGVDISDEFNKKGLHNALKDMLTNGLSPKN
jgi:hypothetical protein